MLEPLGFSFLLHEQKKRNKDELLRTVSEKNAVCCFLVTPALFCAKQKELAFSSNSFLLV